MLNLQEKHTIMSFEFWVISTPKSHFSRGFIIDHIGIKEWKIESMKIPKWWVNEHSTSIYLSWSDLYLSVGLLLTTQVVTIYRRNIDMIQ